MTIQVGGTTVISGERVLSNVTGLKTVGGQSILGTGDIAAGGASGGMFYENDQTLTTNYTITLNKNAMSAGPVTIGNGAEVTIPNGSTWTVV